MQMTIGDFLLKRLKELGIEHVFGVPGDYNLGFLDQIVNDSGIEWVGNCNELNASYAADGYARIRGASAIVTTFGVGELSAINGIAGAYAEHVPIINIVGMPSLQTQSDKLLVHHTLGDGDFTVFSDIYRRFTVAQTCLTESDPATEIDSAIRKAWVEKRPVYIGIPTDISYKTIEVNAEPLDLSFPKSDTNAIDEVTNHIAHKIKVAKKPVFLVDMCVARHSMQTQVQALIDKTGIPFAAMNMGKGILNESHPAFLGSYNGDFSAPGVQAYVESSDCVLSFGTIASDFNTGGFTSKVGIDVSIKMHSDYIDLHHSTYHDVRFEDYLPILTKKLAGIHFEHTLDKSEPEKITAEANPIRQKRFWPMMSAFVEPGNIVVAEAGTSMFGSMQMPLPDQTTYVGQPLWGSIGYTVGSLLGTCMAAPDKQSILFIGDGSFQLTAQEISTMIKQKLNPIVFLINNDGYTVERVIHGPTMPYNDVNMWKYAELPKVFGENVWSTAVKTETELDAALIEAKKRTDQFRFIEVIMTKEDAPEILIKIGAACAAQNDYSG